MTQPASLAHCHCGWRYWWAPLSWHCGGQALCGSLPWYGRALCGTSRWSGRAPPAPRRFSLSHCDRTGAARAITAGPGRGRLGALGLGTLQALRLLWRVHPHLVVGAGGYVMGPVVLAAYSAARAPCAHGAKSRPRADGAGSGALCPASCLSPFQRARRICRAGPWSIPGRRCVRRFARSALAEPREADGELHLLVFGGSQGAHRLNQAMMQAAPWLAAHQPRLCLVHQTGLADAAAVTQAYAQAGSAGGSCSISA